MSLSPRVEEWKRSWAVAISAMLGVSFVAVPLYSIGAFLLPLEAEFGWSRTSISAGLTIETFVAAILLPIGGMMVDRFGPRRVALPGVLLFGGALALLSLTDASLPVWFFLWFLVGFACVLGGAHIWVVGVSSSFDHGRGLAIAVALSGPSMAAAISPPIATFYIDQFGWRAAYVGLALTWIVMIFPLAFLAFRTPADRKMPSEATGTPAQALTGLDLREGIRSRPFIIIFFAAIAITLGGVPFAVMMIPILKEGGIPVAKAAELGVLLGISSVTGRITVGYLLDRFPANIIGGMSCLLPIVSCLTLILFSGSVPAATVAIVALGLSLGAEYDAAAYLTGRHLGLKRFGTFYSFIGGAISISVGLGTMLLSYIYDVTGSYILGLWVGIPLAALGATLFFSLSASPRWKNIPGAQAAAFSG